MGRHFTYGSGEHFTTTATPLTTETALTMACWVYHNNLTFRSRYVWVHPNSDEGYILWFFEGTNVPVFSVVNSGGSASATGGSISNNTWHHVCGVNRSTTSRELYLDGVSVGTDNTLSTPAAMDRMTIAGNSARTANWMDGRIAEIGIWNVALSPLEVQQLGQWRHAPPMVRSKNLKFYKSFQHEHPDSNGQIDVSDSPHIQHPGIPLTNVGSTFAAHPPNIIYPRRPLAWMLAPTAAADPEGPLTRGKLIRGGILAGRLVA